MRTLTALLVGGALVLSACSCASERNSATEAGSCVAPFLRSDDARHPPSPGRPTTLGRVVPGQQITIFGRWYYAGPCNDVGTIGSTPTPARTGQPVPLQLTTSDHSTRVVATGMPNGPEAGFAATFVLPDDAKVGPARISDGEGHIVTLTIAHP
jgi:hypothetical protein